MQATAPVFLLFALPAFLVACKSSVPQFPLAEPMWVDPDKRPFSERPKENFSPFGWDGADKMFFRPMARVFAVEPAGQAVNVNSLDEVARLQLVSK